MARSPKTNSDSKEFAIIETGGKQYKVSAGDIISIEKMKGAYSAGDTLNFDKVLMVDDGENTTIGTPYITGASVSGKLKEAGRGDKIDVVKYKAKSRYYKKRGHRQPFFKIEITSIK